MKDINYRYVIVLIVSFLFAGCNILASDEGERADFVGTVESSSGNAIENAEIHIEYEGVKMGESSAHYYSFSMHRGGDIVHTLYRLGFEDPVYHRRIQDMQSGRHAMRIGVDSLTNGVYRFIHRHREVRDSLLVLRHHRHVDSLLQTSPLARTDGEGRFRMDHEIFGMGKSVRVYRDTIEIRNPVTFIIHSPEAGTLKQKVHIKETSQDVRFSY